MIPLENRQLIYEDNRETEIGSQSLKIIAFNDVYNIEEVKKGQGGAARFYTALEHIRSGQKQDSLLLFAGDAVSPSSLSIFAKGDQMIDVLNEFKIDAAAIGNHEFDMGLDTLEGLIKKSNFPWLLSNVFDAETDEPFIEAEKKHVMNINGLKIGVFALAEKEWCKSLCCVRFEDLKYENYIEATQKMTNELRTKDNVDIVIALTHMRWENDEKLAKKCPEIDVIIGGHDHDYGVQKINDRLVVKSGTDFCEFSVVELCFNKESADSKVYVKKIEKIIVDSKIEENEKIKEIVTKYTEQVNSLLDREIGKLNCDLDGRYETVRYKESNLGNFLCDIIVSAVDADCCIINGGALRSNRLHKAGKFTIRDMRDILSFESELVVLTVKGAQLHGFLENCVKNYGNGGGRYPQVSNIFFAFDPKKPPGQRIDTRLVHVNNELLDLNETYSVCTNVFLKNVDEILQTCAVKINSESIPQLVNLVENYFQAVNAKINNLPEKKFNTPIVARKTEEALISHLSIIVPAREAQKNKKLQKSLSLDNASLVITRALRARSIARKKIILYKERKCIKESSLYKEKMKELESKSLMLMPKLEIRSVLIDSTEAYDALLGYAELKLRKRKLKNKLKNVKTTA